MKNKIISLALAVIMLLSVFALTACKEPEPTCDHTNLSSTYSKNQTQHWKTCIGCNTTEKFQLGDHDFEDGVCTVCEYEEGVEIVEYPWSSAEIKFQLSKNNNGGELSSECIRYISGTSTDPTHNALIDTLVLERNALCVAETGVSVDWSYLENIESTGWGANIETIYNTVATQSKNCPDVFCNFVYDMVSVSLKGSFANLNATDLGSEANGTYGLNYFEFANDPYYKDKTVTDENGVTTTYGYMYDYMRSLTLSRKKMYLISSDYFTDMVRAFYCIPVNSKLMNEEFQVDPESAVFKDRTGDGVFNMNDFFQLVLDKEWNYETMAVFCQKIAADEEDDNSKGIYDLRDRVGFALDGNSGLSASGILYSTSLVIIEREFSEKENEYVFHYPETNPELVDFCDKLYKLFDTNGVISVRSDKGQTYGYKTEGGEGGASDAILARFAENKVLFGNIVCIGSLEGATYQNMADGFGVVPVPLYRTNYVDEATGETKIDPYLTQVHNLGRIGAIAACSSKFAECSAYINYQSLNSKDILEEYYNGVLKGKIASGANAVGNEQMLKYIRQNVRSSFDKVFEDAIAVYFKAQNEDATYEKWHEMIKGDGNNHDPYKLTTMSTEYATIAARKQGFLELLKGEYESFT